jgi:peptidoglycan L-alanyl-D-glutamate endopeptidase CwlK
MAADVVPYPIDWRNLERFHELAGVVKAVAFTLKDAGLIESDIEWGGDWTWKDLPHYQVKG